MSRLNSDANYIDWAIFESRNNCTPARKSSNGVLSSRLFFRNEPFGEYVEGPFLPELEALLARRFEFNPQPIWSRVLLPVCHNSCLELLFRRFKHLASSCRIIGGKLELRVGKPLQKA